MKVEEVLNSLHTEFPELREEVGAGQPVEASEFSDSDTVRAVRQSIIAELDATNMYTQLADSIENEDIKNLLKQIAKEEEVHVGEFEKALATLHPETVDNVEDGKEEAAGILGNSEPNEEADIETEKEDTIEEALARMYRDFPELHEASPAGAFAGSLINQGLQKLPIIGPAMNAYQANKQKPAAAAQPAAPAATTAPAATPAAKTGGLGGAIGKAFAAASNVKTQKQNAMNSLATAGQSGSQILDNVKAALTTFVGAQEQAPEQQAPAQPTNTVPTEGTQKDQPAAAAAQGGAAPIPESTRAYSAILQELYSFEDTHLTEGNKQQVAAIKKAAQSVLNAMGSGDSSTWASNKTVIDGIKKILQGSQQFKIDVGLQGITPEVIDQAVSQLSQPAAPDGSTPAQPGTQPSAQPQQTVQQMNPDQVATIISGMDRRALKQIVQNNPDLAQQVVAAMGKTQGQQ